MEIWCEECDGQGFYRLEYSDSNKKVYKKEKVKCARCNGTGHYYFDYEKEVRKIKLRNSCD